MIFFAIEQRLGAVLLFFMLAVEVLVFWIYGISQFDFTLAVTSMLSALVIMTLSLLLSRTKHQEGARII
jgi:hypothetical protein